MTRDRQQLLGRIGGLTAWAMLPAEVMVGPAHAGFRRRFENLVDPDRVLPEAEREARADRARRAHMLGLAAKSAAARKRKAAPVSETPGAAKEDVGWPAALERAQEAHSRWQWLTEAERAALEDAIDREIDAATPAIPTDPDAAEADRRRREFAIIDGMLDGPAAPAMDPVGPAALTLDPADAADLRRRLGLPARLVIDE